MDQVSQNSPSFQNQSSPGLQEIQKLRAAGFSDTEISQWHDETQQKLAAGGFSQQEVNDYFGVKEPDMTPVKNYFKKNLDQYAQKKKEELDSKREQENAKPNPDIGPISPQPEQADSFLEAMDAGWQMSVSGLFHRGKLPDTVLPEHASAAAQIAYQSAELVGDMPAIVAGMFGGASTGATLGSAVPVIGTAAGAFYGGAAGAMALPAGLRDILIDQYKKGEFHNFSDFWNRSSSIFYDMAKKGAVGIATAGTGEVTGRIAPALESSLAPTVGKTAAGIGATIFHKTAEVGAMVTAGKAMEGQVPSVSDFTTAAAMVGILHLGGVLRPTPQAELSPPVKENIQDQVTNKLQDIYAKTGAHPADIALKTQEDPVLRDEVVSTNIEVPKSLVPYAENYEAPVEIKETGGADWIGDGGLGVGIKPSDKEAILSRIVTDREKPSKLSYDSIYTAAIDDLHPVNVLEKTLTGGKELDASQSPYKQMRLNRGNMGRVEYFLNEAPFRFSDYKDTGAKSLKAILKPVAKEMDDFRTYAVSKRALELESRGIEHGVDIDAASRVVNDGASKYQKTFKELVDFQDSALTYLRDSGVLDPKSYDNIRAANKDFIPFYRHFTEDEVRTGGGRGLSVKNPVKSIKGSEREIIDPIETIIKNTFTYITMAERNRALNSLVDLAEKSEIGNTLVEKSKPQMQPIEIKGKEIEKALNDQGFDIDGNVESLTTFRAMKTPLAKDEFAVFRKGKRQVYRVDPEVAKAIQALDGQSMAPLAKLALDMAAKPAGLLRASVGISPDFIVRNLIRDTAMATVMSKNRFIPLYSAAVGMMDRLLDGEAYQNWKKSGGASATLVSIDRDYIQENLFDLNRKTGFMTSARNVVKSPVALARLASEVAEEATRVGEFKLAQKRGKSLAQSAFESREVTLDFQRVGANARVVNMIVPFFNAGVQGVDRVIREFKENPGPTAFKSAVAMTIPSVVLWLRNQGDPRYKEIPAWEKNLYYIVMTDKWEDAQDQSGAATGTPSYLTRIHNGKVQVNNGTIYRIPKSQEVGVILGSFPERMMESFFTDNPHKLRDFADTVLSAITPNIVPSAAQPFVEQWANKTFFTGTPVIPAQLENVLPQYQYKEYTTETAKQIGKFIAHVPGFRESEAASPLVIENLVRSWSGNLGMYALQATDKILESTGMVTEPNHPETPLSEIPFIKAFLVRFPTAGAESIQQFYDNYDEWEKAHTTIKYLQKAGDFEAAQKELERAGANGTLFNLKRFKKAMSAQAKMIHGISKAKEMKPEEKRQQIDSLYLMMIQEAKYANDQLGAFKKQQKTTK